MQINIDAVIVTYNPEFDVFKASLASISSQVRMVYVVDNSEGQIEQSFVEQSVCSYDNVVVVSGGENRGIGAAQNIGLKIAMEKGADFTLLSDQDTIFPEFFINNMIGNFLEIEENNRVAAIAPDFSENNKGGKKEGFFEIVGLSSVRLVSDLKYQEVGQVIASGMIINNKLLLDIGMMDEDLFIDWVDFEWCWRARSKRYRIIGCRNVVINHALGDSAISIRGSSYSLHSPERNYYIVRNGIFISLKKTYLPFRMRLAIFFKACRYVIAFSIFGSSHFKNVFYCGKGFVHGVFSKVGRLK